MLNTILRAVLTSSGCPRGYAALPDISSGLIGAFLVRTHTSVVPGVIPGVLLRMNTSTLMISDRYTFSPNYLTNLEVVSLVP